MRRILAAALVAAVFATAFWLGFVVAPDAEAGGQNRCGTQIKYYSDATYTTQIGLDVWRPESCNCFYHGWGSPSPWRVILPATCYD